MTEAEKKELAELTKKCIDKRSDRPKKLAETADLERLQVLQLAEQKERQEKEKKEKELKPLTFDEREEMDDLERRARSGRQIFHPSPHEMRRLKDLRERAQVR